jgi:hypothetical protein
MKKHHAFASVILALIASLWFCQISSAQPGSSSSPIHPNDLSKFIAADALVYPGDNALDTKAITIGDLILSAAGIGLDSGISVGIYKDSAIDVNPTDEHEYITIVNYGESQGFNIIFPTAGSSKKSDAEVFFSFRCNVKKEKKGLSLPSKKPKGEGPKSPKPQKEAFLGSIGGKETLKPYKKAVKAYAGNTERAKGVLTPKGLRQKAPETGL